jgi:hypothetical protein
LLVYIHIHFPYRYSEFCVTSIIQNIVKIVKFIEYILKRIQVRSA